MRLLVIEDGHEYEEFARAFLAGWNVSAAHTAAEALAAIVEAPVARLLVDLRFERASVDDLVGDVDAVAQRRFGGDRFRAARYLKEQQGTLILGELRKAGCDAPALFVHDFSERRLSNLRRLYGVVNAVPRFDAALMQAALESA